MFIEEYFEHIHLPVIELEHLILPLNRGVASSKSQGGQKAQFALNFQRIHFLLHFYVTFLDFSKSEGSADPSEPLVTTPLPLNEQTSIIDHNLTHQ